MTHDRDWTRRERPQNRGSRRLGFRRLPAARVAGYSPSAADPDRIRHENEQPGTRDWMTTNVRIDPKTKYRCSLDRGLRVEDERAAG